SAQAEPLSDFTVLVALDPSRVNYGQTQGVGQDLRFTDEDGTTALDHELERWNDGGLSYLWVRVPRIDASSSTDSIVMYYGNDGAADGANSLSTWQNGYTGVWHLDRDLADSTRNGADGTTMGATAEAGVASDGRRFAGAGHRIETNTAVGSAPDLTFSFWMRSGVDNGYHRPIDKSPNLGTQGWSVLQRPTGDTFSRGLVFRVGSGSSYGGWGNEVSVSDVYAVDSWVYVAGTYDSASTTGRLYIDGVLVDEVTNMDGRGVANTDTTLKIGSANGFERFVGLIDEVRVSNTARSPAFIAAQHLSQSDTFITFGAEEPVGMNCPE
ncbi:MAG: DUF2341 domain-containing protein, partial [Deltaproteobacteria bacterium]|nr:DUF2341 domain-containing protein [Deltaproteobacteria bacterium]